MATVPVFLNLYRARLADARRHSPRITAATSDPSSLPRNARYYLSGDGLSGYGITPSGDFIGLFSSAPGRGSEMIREALTRGARTLDCFDGFLPGLYARHGFREVRREQNWTPGGPDVVFMELAQD